MSIYTLEELSLREIKALRQSLDHIPITGIDAMFIALLQNKITTQINQIEEHLKFEEEEKKKKLEETVSQDLKQKPTPSNRGKK